jgi:hypothetical protein
MVEIQMCSECGKDEFVWENNYNVCMNCGLQCDFQPKYYMSYALPRYEYRRQYYSRAKRFIKVLRGMMSNIIGDHFENILHVYGEIEFRWLMKLNKTRKYFYSQKMVLWFILNRLEIPLCVPTLKNKERATCQIKSMTEILKK